MAKRMPDGHLNGGANLNDGQTTGGKELEQYINQIAFGAHTVTSAEDSAGTLDITTGLASITTKQVQVLTTAGVNKTGDLVITASGGTITVADGSGSTIDATDVVEWLAAVDV